MHFVLRATRHFAKVRMDGMRTVVVLTCALLACSDSPTAVVELGELQGIWEINVQANASCDPSALERTINFGLETLHTDEGVILHGFWTPGGAFETGSSFQGAYDQETQQISLLFIHSASQSVVAFEGTAKSRNRIDGRLVPPPADREPYWSTGGCEQKGTARKVLEFPTS